jgi:hypothetical protein
MPRSSAEALRPWQGMPVVHTGVPNQMTARLFRSGDTPCGVGQQEEMVGVRHDPPRRTERASDEQMHGLASRS